MSLEIIKAIYLNEFKIDITFNNGVNKTVDFYDFLFNHDYPVFIPLRDVNRFKKFKVNDTIIWEGDVDLAPERIFDLN